MTNTSQTQTANNPDTVLDLSLTPDERKEQQENPYIEYKTRKMPETLFKKILSFIAIPLSLIFKPIAYLWNKISNATKKTLDGDYTGAVATATGTNGILTQEEGKVQPLNLAYTATNKTLSAGWTIVGTAALSNPFTYVGGYVIYFLTDKLDEYAHKEDIKTLFNLTCDTDSTEFKKYYKALDINGDEIVDGQELYATAAILSEKGITPDKITPENSQSVLEYVKKVLPYYVDKYYKEKKGKNELYTILTKNSNTISTRSEFKEDMRDLVEQTWQQFDFDQSGDVDREEYRTALTYLDSNKDGVVSDREVKKHFHTPHVQNAGTPTQREEAFRKNSTDVFKNMQEHQRKIMQQKE